MNYNFINKSTHILLLLIFISHLTFAHDLMSEYVLCTGSDGHIAIEKVDDCTECNNVNYFDQTDGVEIKQQSCEDVSLEENCFEEEQFLPKSKIVLSTYITTFAFIPIETYNNKDKFYSNNFYQLIDQPLENYTTVSLII